MVDAILLTSAEIFHPTLHRHLHMTRKRPYRRIVLATKKHRMPIGIEVGAFDMEILEAIQNI